MSFQKKDHKDTRPKMGPLATREAKVAALKSENSIEARKQLKRMNDKVYRGSRSNLKEWYKPTGKGVTCNV